MEIGKETDERTLSVLLNMSNQKKPVIAETDIVRSTWHSCAPGKADSYRLVTAASKGCRKLRLPLTSRLQHCTKSTCKHLKHNERSTELFT